MHEPARSIHGWASALAEPRYLLAACQTSSADCPREAAQQGALTAATVQTLAFRAATGKAFTTFFAGLAFTMTTLPKTSLLPAFVAGFIRVLILQARKSEDAALDHFLGSPC